MTETPPSPNQQALKRRRITRACDRCHKGGIKCAPSGLDQNTCAPCAAFGSVCTYDRPVKRRGPPAKTEREGGNQASSSGSDSGRFVQAKASGEGKRNSGVTDGWRGVRVASPEIIEELVEGYHRVVYPILPYFHWPTFSYDVRRRRYLHDRPFYAATMAVCAITSARLRDGAQLPHTPSTFPPSERFYEAAQSALPRNLVDAGEFDYKRTKALFVMLNIQYGRVREVKLQLGELITMFSLEGFHNESRWPSGLNPIEVEERRRLFWTIYQSDVYAAIIWGGMVQLRESQITVGYPTEVLDDTEITPSGFFPTPRPPSSSSNHRSSVSFFKGWNFVVDLYRILEHATDRLRATWTGSASGVDEVMGLYTRKAGPDPAEVMNTVAGMYGNLPIEFKRVKAMNGNLEEDRYGFTATNIIITLQTLRSVIAGTEEANVHQRCSIAAEMLEALASVPTPYIQASSAPMLHHLAGVGHLLGSIIQSPLSQHTYLRVRTVLLALADMLSSLEVALSRDSNIATRLRAHVFRIDNYMTAASQQQQPSTLPIHTQSQSQIPGPMGMTGDKAFMADSYLPSLYPPQSSDTRTHIPDLITLPTNASMGGAPSIQTNDVTLRLDTGDIPDHQETSTTRTDTDTAPVVVDPALENNGTPGLGIDWAPSVNVSPTQRFQLPDDLFQDWPFDIGQGDVFDWLRDLQGTATSDVPGGTAWNGS